MKGKHDIVRILWIICSLCILIPLCVKVGILSYKEAYASDVNIAEYVFYVDKMLLSTDDKAFYIIYDDDTQTLIDENNLHAYAPSTLVIDKIDALRSASTIITTVKCHSSDIRIQEYVITTTESGVGDLSLVNNYTMESLFSTKIKYIIKSVGLI